MNEKFEQAFKIKQSVAGVYLGYRDAFHDIKGEITRNTELSSVGKRQEIERAKVRVAAELFAQLVKMKQLYLGFVNNAKADAEKVLSQGVQKPSDGVIEQFHGKFNYLKTELLLAPTLENARERLNKFMDEHNDSYLIQLTAERFSELVPMMLGKDNKGMSDMQVRALLSQTFTDIQDRSVPDEIKAARETVRTAEGWASLNIIPLAAKQNAVVVFGRVLAHYLDKPEEFFEQPKYEKYADMVKQ